MLESNAVSELPQGLVLFFTAKCWFHIYLFVSNYAYPADWCKENTSIYSITLSTVDKIICTLFFQVYMCENMIFHFCLFAKIESCLHSNTLIFSAIIINFYKRKSTSFIKISTNPHIPIRISKNFIDAVLSERWLIRKSGQCLDKSLVIMCFKQNMRLREKSRTWRVVSRKS